MNILYQDKVNEILNNQIKLVSTYQEISDIVSDIKSDENLNLLLKSINEYKETLDKFKKVEAAGFVPGFFLWTFSRNLYDLLKTTFDEGTTMLPEEIEQLNNIIVKIKDIERKKNELNDYIVTKSANINTDTLKNKTESIYTDMYRLEKMIDDNMVSGFDLSKDFLRKLKSLNEAQKTVYTSEKLFQDTVQKTGLQNGLSTLLKMSFILPETRNIIYGYVPDKDGNIPNANKFFIPIIYRPGGFPELKLPVYKQIVEIKYAINIGRLRKILDDDTQYSVFLNALKQYPSCNFDSMVFNTEDQKCMKLLIDSFMNIINESNYSVQKKNEIITFLSKGKLEAEKIIKQRGTSVMYGFTKTASKNKTRKRSSNIPKSLENKPEPKKCKVVLQSGRRSGKECGRDIPCLYHDEPEENETNNQSGGKKKKTYKKSGKKKLKHTRKHKKKSGKKKKTIKKHKKKH